MTGKERSREMVEHHKNYSVEHIGPLEELLHREFLGFKGKYMIGQELGLTGCEVSLNRLPAGKGMPIVHTHKKNEELYIVLKGSGIFYGWGRISHSGREPDPGGPRRRAGLEGRS
jgi:uncharacterized cupin superfamily protein